MIIHFGEQDAQRQAACHADTEHARTDAAGGENRDRQRDGEQIARRSSEEDGQRAGEEDEHPLRQEIAPVSGAPDQDAGADGDGSPEQRVQIVESRSNRGR